MMASLLRVVHWGPLIALFIIASVTITSTYSALQLWSLPHVKYFRLLNFIFMYVWLFPILINFFHALSEGPGYVPLGWKPADAEEEKYLQYCQVCRGFKPPRSHHCRQCGRCIKKMDHHCPWINHCVGHGNHASFTRFLFFVPFGCVHGVVLNINFLYRLLMFDFLYNRPYLRLNTFWMIYTISTVGLALGTTVGVFVLFVIQMRSIVTNKTQIEDWIVDKAKHRRSEDDEPFEYPYDLGRWKNFTQVINCAGKAVGDGVEWPVKEDCSKFALTMEQLEQKKQKKASAISCEVQHTYSGSSCPLSYGIGTSLCAPRCSERAISVSRGDTVTITRWQRYWVYGDKKLTKAEIEKGVRMKGWIPRKCVGTPTTDKGQSSKKKKQE